ncbi:MAG: 3-hydroxyacyl-CoA dehydrogenase NAD-binding domain-containing protein [Caulobacterales bacterium]|nr:3-hydroxyacyl-CoA dehydrogenase NAD-binding domain-containing protein [Caulobacterales bacterium]
MSAQATERVAVIGGGRMGCGVAYRFAAAGHPVAICEPDDARRAALPAAIARICDLLESDRSIVESVRLSAGVDEAARDAAFVVEAAPEDLALKQSIFGELDAVTGPAAILATNTSAIPVSSIAKACARPERVLGAHFWNPPHLAPLVEVVHGRRTDPGAARQAMDLLRAAGLTPVEVRKDVPGFVGNRLQHALKREAIALVANGVCDAETVDTVVKLGFGPRLAVMGPLEQSDLLGLHLTLAIHETLMPDLDVTREPHPLLRDTIAAGHVGASVGQGFRTWSEEEAEAARRRLDAHLLAAERERRRG